ncbi:putative transposase (ISH9) [Haloferax mediterranei ATCC 33500]|uniref:Transposase n=1 Tax=Haloferax mediterranei (strain ATCC 33500 / DSM 1411 / JCM 8866 / NBRC 14739 / NCIMB 2177 / R-4) TaxID=523841 RepID=I3R9A2_HALMT|nr:transposase [Haloferax mediterranei ATCC 33500]ELZ97518.1 putative transposase (ISH9) [Haloferax mediterranei ATCC 33500]
MPSAAAPVGAAARPLETWCNRRYILRTLGCEPPLLPADELPRAEVKVTKLVDTDSQAILDVHCSTNREGSDADLCEQIARRNAGDLRSLAADKGYDKKSLRESLRNLGIRPLIKHRIFAPYDYAHNARIDEQRYNQRSMTETVNSAVKRSLGFAVRARSWFREFREIALMCVVYNIKRAVKQ